MNGYVLDAETLVSLDGVTKVFQMLFYVVGSWMAILTYRSAKRGLLNTVNTEYQKRVIDRLKELSEELYSEFDRASDNYWGKKQSVEKIVDDINKAFIAHKKQILEKGKFGGGILEPDELKMVEGLASKIATDPFLPKKIRDDVARLLSGRMRAIVEIYMEEFDYYRTQLAQGKHSSPEDLERNSGWVHNRINSRLYERGFGVAQMQEAVNQIRLSIQAYLEGFDPLHGEGRAKRRLTP